MQSIDFKPQVLVLPNVRINYQSFAINQEEEKEVISDLLKPLTEKGLNCLTTAKIELVICTSALSAHI